MNSSFDDPPSNIFSIATTNNIALLDIDEIVIGKESSHYYYDYGQENLYQVRDVKGFTFSNNGDDDAFNNTNDDDFVVARRALYQSHAAANMSISRQHNHKSYTIKTIHKSSFINCSHEQFERAAAYLANEASMMTMLGTQHANIMKLNGVAALGTEAYYQTGRHDAYFLITEALHDSLPSKLSSWRKKQQRKLPQLMMMRRRRSSSSSSSSSNKTRSSVKERLQVAYNLADAIEYMHSRDIIHRRIHPNVVGFNSMNQLQLHGLGDAIHWNSNDNNNNNSLEIPPNRYSPANDSCASPASDVYTFARVLCELITLCKIRPDGQLENSMLYLQRCQYWSNKLPKSIFECLHQALSPDDPNQRPTMTDLKAAIDEALYYLDNSATSVNSPEPKKNKEGLLPKLKKQARSSSSSLSTFLGRSSSSRMMMMQQENDDNNDDGDGFPDGPPIGDL